MKISVTALTVIITILLLAGCSGNSPRDTGTPVSTEFGRMLGFVPRSFLEEHDIWYTNPGAIKKRYGLENLDCAEDIRQLEGEKGKEFLNAFRALPDAQSYLSSYEMKPFTGWNWVNIDRAVFCEIPPPWGFSVVEGDFDESLIGERLTGQGYAKSEYGAYTCYHLNDDMQINIRSEVGSKVMAQLNRVAVLDDRLVAAPATGIMTSVLDAMAGNEDSIIASPSSRAICDSLGEIQGAVLITPDRILQPYTDSTPAFDQPAASEWGTLHDYSLFGTGYLDNGSERYWIISLYYNDGETAAADAAASADACELASRLESYVFCTHLKQAENVPLTSMYEVGEPVVREYPGGATLTVKCRHLPESTGSMSLYILLVPGRDLLFLATDPADYISTAAPADNCKPAGYDCIDYTGAKASSQGTG